MSASMALHGARFVSAHHADRTWWLKFETEDDCGVSIFFYSASDMVRMLHAALDSALKLERELKGSG